MTINLDIIAPMYKAMPSATGSYLKLEGVDLQQLADAIPEHAIYDLEQMLKIRAEKIMSDEARRAKAARQP
jgi:hypothetical protein